MTRKYENREDEILRAYVKLLQAMFMGVYDRIRIKDSWHTKKLSQRMITRKLNDLKELGAWLKTDECTIWFNMLGYCTGNGSRKMHETFNKTHADSVKFMKKHKVDKVGIDRKGKKR
jgi:hypothetical protein